MKPDKKHFQFSGRKFTREELVLMQEVVKDFPRLTRTELSGTLCELLRWRRPSGGLKILECRNFLEKLESQGFLTLPEKRNTQHKSRPEVTMAPPTNGDEPWKQLSGSAGEFAPLDVELVRSREHRHLFRELVQRYHYLGYANPYGARLQYLVYVTRPERQLVGCVQFSSPAWRMKARDQWIGWDDATRGNHLQHVVNNSRFLVLASLRNLSSMLLSSVLKRLRRDWHASYGLDPWLVETLVDRQLFHGGCYRAANWIVVGETTGRGRMDRSHKRHNAQVKTVLIYPLVRNAADLLKKGGIRK